MSNRDKILKIYQKLKIGCGRKLLMIKKLRSI